MDIPTNAAPKLRRAVFASEVTSLQRDDAGTGAITVHAVVSTRNVARGDGAIIEDWTLDNYRKNPVVLFSHDPRQVIGRASNVKMTAAGLEADIEFVDASTSPAGHVYGKMAAARWFNGLSVGFDVVTERLPTEAERTKGARAVWRGELLEISLVAVPADPDALIVDRSFTFTEKEVALAKAQFSSIDGWAPLLRSLELSLEAAPGGQAAMGSATTPASGQAASGTSTTSVGATAHTVRWETAPQNRSPDDLFVEARDLLTRLQELLAELGQQAEPRSRKSDAAGTSAPQAPPAPAVVEVRPQDASASALDMRRLWEAMRRGSNFNGTGHQGDAHTG